MKGLSDLDSILRAKDVGACVERVCQKLLLKRVYRLLHIRVVPYRIFVSRPHYLVSEFCLLIRLEGWTKMSEDDKDTKNAKL